MALHGFPLHLGAPLWRWHATKPHHISKQLQYSQRLFSGSLDGSVFDFRYESEHEGGPAHDPVRMIRETGDRYHKSARGLCTKPPAGSEDSTALRLRMVGQALVRSAFHRFSGSSALANRHGSTLAGLSPRSTALRRPNRSARHEDDSELRKTMSGAVSATPQRSGTNSSGTAGIVSNSAGSAVCRAALGWYVPSRNGAATFNPISSTDGFGWPSFWNREVMNAAAVVYSESDSRQSPVYGCDGYAGSARIVSSAARPSVRLLESRLPARQAVLDQRRRNTRLTQRAKAVQAERSLLPDFPLEP